MTLRSRSWVIDFNRCSGKAQVRRATLSCDSSYFEGMVNQIYPPELQLNEANISDTEAPFLDLHLSVSNGFVSSKIYDKRDDFDFPFLDGVACFLWCIHFATY